MLVGCFLIVASGILILILSSRRSWVAILMCKFKIKSVKNINSVII
jgi:hypothetical protein